AEGRRGRRRARASRRGAGRRAGDLRGRRPPLSRDSAAPRPWASPHGRRRGARAPPPLKKVTDTFYENRTPFSENRCQTPFSENWCQAPFFALRNRCPVPFFRKSVSDTGSR